MTIINKDIGAITNENKTLFCNSGLVYSHNRGKTEYAIGKAMHLWLLDNIELDAEKTLLLKNFIEDCYPNENELLK